jgi:MFS family permease
MHQQAMPEIAAAPTRVRYVMLGWFCSLSMITYIDRVSIMHLSSDMRHDLCLSDEQFAYVFSAFSLAYALLEVPSGWLGDRFGTRCVLTRIVLCWSAFTAMTGVAWNYVSLLVIRFLFGAGESGAYPNIGRGSRSWFPFRERGQAQGMVWLSGRWGGAFAPFLIGALAMFLPWRLIFVVLGLIGVGWIVGFKAYYRDGPDEHPGVNDAERRLIDVHAAGPLPPAAPLSWSATLRSPTLWLLSIMYFCSNAGWHFFISWGKDYLQKDLKLTGLILVGASGAPLFFGGIACVLGGLFTDRQVRGWGRRWGRTAIGCVAYALAGAFFLLALAMTDDFALWAFLGLCLASFFKDVAMPVSWATTLDIGHRYSGTVAGIMNTVGNLGAVISPPIVKALSSGGNWKSALVYSAVMFFVASACWLFINPRRVVVYAEADRIRLHAQGVLD